MGRKTKTFVSVFAIAALLAVTVAAAASSADAEDVYGIYDGIKYKVLDGNKLEVVANSYSGEITIPETANGMTVTKIGALAFQNCTTLTKVTIMGNVTMEGNAFSGAKPVTVIMDKVKEIPDNFFNGHAQLRTVSMKGVETIGKYAFNETGITSLEIPKVITIKEWAFFGCISLASELTLPASLVTLEKEAFHSAPLTGGLIFEEGIKITQIHTSTFNDCRFSSLTLPQNLLTIGEHVFRSNSNLKTVVIPQSVTNLDLGDNPDYGSFDTCPIENLTLPDTLMRDKTFTKRTDSKPLNLTIIVGETVNTNSNGVITGYFSSGKDWKSFLDGKDNLKNITLAGKTGVTSSNAWSVIQNSTPANGCTVTDIDGTVYTRINNAWAVTSQKLTLTDDNNSNPICLVVTKGTILPAFTAHSKAGHNLTGYYDASDNQIIDGNGKLSTTYADADGKWNGTLIPALKAKFAVKNDLTYTVKYQTAGGVSLAADETVTGQTYNATINVSAKAISGYNADAATKSITIADGTNTVIFIYTAVPPVYVPSTYDITLVNGPGDRTSFTAIRGSSHMSGYSSPSRDGLTFGGYWTSPSGGSQVITAGGAYADCPGYVSSGRWSGSACTLYAQWTGASSAVLSLDLNGASSGSTSVTVSVGAAAMPQSYKAPVRGSVEFLGYYFGQSLVIKADGSFGSGADVLTDGSGTWIYAGGSVTLTAKWGNSKTLVALNLNGTTYGSAFVYIQGGAASVPADYVKPIKYGFVFDGYCAAGDLRVITADGSFSPSVSGITDGSGKWIYEGANLDLTAKWKSLIDFEVMPEGKITYYGNDGTFANSAEVAGGKSFIGFDNPPVRHGYRFLGWAETPDAAEAKYAVGSDAVPAYFDTSLYAVWELSVSIDAEISALKNNAAFFIITAISIILMLAYTRRRENHTDEA